jgi:hypothetical protein
MQTTYALSPEGLAETAGYSLETPTFYHNYLDTKNNTDVTDVVFNRSPSQV